MVRRVRRVRRGRRGRIVQMGDIQNTQKMKMVRMMTIAFRAWVDLFRGCLSATSRGGWVVGGCVVAERQKFFGCGRTK